MMSLPLCELIVHKLCEIKTKILDNSTHIGRLIIIDNYSNAPSIAHSVYRIDKMMNTAYTSREDKRIAGHYLQDTIYKSGKIQKVHSVLILSTCL